MPRQVKNIQINLEVDVLTSGAVAKVVVDLFDFLLYQRNQIPFVYPTFKYYVNKWSQKAEDIDGNNEIAGSKEFYLQRQRNLAKQTKDAISDMRELIRNIFAKRSVRYLRFLFGATTFTPKEVYTIHIPTASINHQHLHAHHEVPPAQVSNRMISLLVEKELYPVFTTPLAATNLYLDFELDNSLFPGSEEVSNIIPKDIGQLPPTCKNIHFHIQHVCPSELKLDGVPKCCSELTVYDDQLITEAAKKQKVNDCKSLSDNKESDGAWWESEIIIRGFKYK